jgi:membrane-associated phospholipid phosphatase
VRSSEWLSFAYFAALTVIGGLRPLPRARRLQIAAAGAASCASVALVARSGGAAARDWAPAAWILAGYYLAARFVVRPSERFEAWLIAVDRRLLGDPTTRFAGWPAALVAALDLLYVYCFLLPPAGLAALMIAGRGDLADRFWTLVSAAALGSYAPLSVIATRPPWAVEPTAALPDARVHAVAAHLVRRFTTRANTFPSGHASASLAVAIALAGPMPAIGVLFSGVALLVGVGCVVGRYHYVADVAAGVLLALVVGAAAGLAGW